MNSRPSIRHETQFDTQALVKPPDKRGFECISCGCRDFRVLYTRPVWGGRILRRRECRHCGRRITTYERTAS